MKYKIGQFILQYKPYGDWEIINFSEEMRLYQITNIYANNVYFKKVKGTNCSTKRGYDISEDIDRCFMVIPKKSIKLIKLFFT